MERSSRCTRSKAAPDWTLEELLMLANEVNAVDAEWRDTLSWFQKWQQIVENCNALGINRSLNQCKMKWETLLEDYQKIEPWAIGFWSFDEEKRAELDLPIDFDMELYEAIGRSVKSKEKNSDGPDTERDSDPEAQADDGMTFLDVGPKKKKRRTTRKHKVGHGYNSWRHVVTAKTKQEEPSSGTNDESASLEVKQQQHYFGVKQEHFTVDDKEEPPRGKVVEKVKLNYIGLDEREEKLATSLCENIDLINMILEGNLGQDLNYRLADLKNVEVAQTELARRQGDKLIDCFRTISDSLSQLCDIVQECD